MILRVKGERQMKVKTNVKAGGGPEWDPTG